jgi:dTDP-4-dehydrorhamnose 3,5-epimerase
MEFEPTRIADVVLIKPRVFGDERGFFLESWQEKKFAAAGIHAHFVQDNHSRSTRHTLRGLHYQTEMAQGKLVRVTSGAVFDVALDIRRSSPTFGKWAAFELSAANRHMLWVPPGFAHGFLALEDSTEFVYKCTDYYAPEFERTILWNDPDLAIPWPLRPGDVPLLSPKDAAGVPFSSAGYFP